MKRNKKRSRWKILIAVGLVLILLLGIYGGWELKRSSDSLTVNEYTVSCDKITEPIRFVYLSDLHGHEFGPENESLAERVRAEAPDFILLGGDILNSYSESADIPIQLVGKLSKIAPVYYTIGNHELEYLTERGEVIYLNPEDKPWSPIVIPPDMEGSFRKACEDAGAVFLQREYDELTVKGQKIRIGGLYEYAFGKGGGRNSSPAEETASFLRDFADTDAVRICLAHRPDSFIFSKDSEKWDADLIVSGHLHGGQVVLPFLGGLYGAEQGLFPDYVHGLYSLGGRPMLISSGLGSAKEKLPRFNNPPEIMVVTLTGAKTEGLRQ